MDLFVYTAHRLLENGRGIYLFIFDFHGEPPKLEEYEFVNQKKFSLWSHFPKNPIYIQPHA